MKTLVEFRQNHVKNIQLLNEALLLNKGKSYNQLCFVCGGAGSGKNFVLDSIILANKNDYKEISSDKVLEGIPKLPTFSKKVTLVINQLDKFFFATSEQLEVSKTFKKIYDSWVAQSIPSVFKDENEFKNYLKKDILAEIIKNEKKIIDKIVYELKYSKKSDLVVSDIKSTITKKNPYLAIGAKNKSDELEKATVAKNLSFLRLMTELLELFDKQIRNRSLVSTGSNHKPNLLVEMIGSLASIKWYVQELNYAPNDTHLIWVVSNIHQAYQSNLKRSRNLEKNALVRTHVTAYNNLLQLFNETTQYIGGEIWIVFNPGKEQRKLIPKIDSEVSVKQQYKKFSEFLRKEKDFDNKIEYFKIKDVGQEIFKNFTGNKKQQFLDLLDRYTDVKNIDS